MTTRRGERILTPLARLSIVIAALSSAAAAPAQVAVPHGLGATMGHLHFHVRDVPGNRAFWQALGATPARPLGDAEVLQFDGLLILLSPGQPTGPGVGSVIDHVALRVKSFAQIEAAGLHLERRRIEGRESGGVVAPSGDRVELFEEWAVQVPFTPDPGRGTPLSARHNRAIEAAVVPHHLHFDVPEGADQAAQAWYLEHFGGVPGLRFHYRAVDLPGMNLNFSGVPATRAPTRGRTLDHVGFEVQDLDAFRRRLAAAGITVAPATTVDGVRSAMLTDPWGVAIELTEGLSRWK